MGLAFDFSNVGDPEKIHEGGSKILPGRGMGVIKEWNEYGGVSGKAHELKIEIVAWTDPGSVAQIHKENIFHEDKSGKGWPMKRFTCLSMAAGLFNANDVREWQKQDSKPEIDMGKLVDRPVFLELVKQMKDGKETGYIEIGQIGMAIYHIKDARCKDWPRNHGIWNANAAKVGDWIETAKAAAPAAKAQTQTAKSTNAAASVDALFGNV